MMINVGCPSLKNDSVLIVLSSYVTVGPVICFTAIACNVVYWTVVHDAALTVYIG